jgi:hypothetical protein
MHQVSPKTGNLTNSSRYGHRRHLKQRLQQPNQTSGMHGWVSRNLAGHLNPRDRDATEVNSACDVQCIAFKPAADMHATKSRLAVGQGG